MPIKTDAIVKLGVTSREAIITGLSLRRLKDVKMCRKKVKKKSFVKNKMPSKIGK
mgnify:CR=1 FL=1